MVLNPSRVQVVWQHILVYSR